MLEKSGRNTFYSANHYMGVPAPSAHHENGGGGGAGHCIRADKQGGEKKPTFNNI